MSVILGAVAVAAVIMVLVPISLLGAAKIEDDIVDTESN